MFGLASAIAWGAGDFAGGLASRRSLVITTLAAVQWLGLLIVAVTAVLTGEAFPPAEALGWGVIAGASGCLGLALFFAAMGRGMISLVTPVTALVSAAVPAIVGMARGEALTGPQLAGMVLALVAVAIISRPLEGDMPGDAAPAGDVRGRLAGSGGVLALAIAAGLGFAGFFLAMDSAQLAGGDLWWPIVAARAAGSALVVAAVLLTRTAPRAPLPVVPLLILAAVGDLGGTAFFNLAIATGPLSLGAVLASMYPVTTILLAWSVLHEHLGRGHLLAVVLALAGVVLMAL